MSSVEERLASLQAQLGQHTRDAASLELRLHSAAATIRRATSLLRQLAREDDTWETDVTIIYSIRYTMIFLTRAKLKNPIFTNCRQIFCD